MAENLQTMKMFLAALDESLRAINAKPEAGAEALGSLRWHGSSRCVENSHPEQAVLVKDMRETLEELPLR